MVKKSKFLIITAISVFIFAMMSILMQETEAQNRQLPFQEQKRQLEQRGLEARNLRWQDRSNTRQQRLRLKGENVLTRIDIRILRLIDIANRIDEIANKLAQKGTDVNKVTDFLLEAKAKFAEASELKTTAEDKLGRLETAEELLPVINEFKEQTHNIYQALSEGRQSLIKAISELKEIQKL